MTDRPDRHQAASNPGGVVRRIGIAILGGAFAPGELLPKEEVYSATLGISRGVYREAIRYLASKGLVEGKRRAGTKVLPRSRWNFLDPECIEWCCEAAPDDRLLEDLLQLRMIIEPAAAEMAARNRAPAQLAAMHAALEMMKVAPFGTEAGFKAGACFHAAVLTATQNEVVASFARCLDAAALWMVRYFERRGQAAIDTYEQHALLYEAIERQDTGYARERMAGIVRRAFDTARVGIAAPADVLNLQRR